MGWTGALGGLGQGMVNYAGTMREQKKMEWKAQQDAVAHERQLNLESIRAGNQRQLAEDKQEWATEERNEAFAQTQGAMTGGYTEEGGFPATKAEMAADPEGNYISEAQHKENVAISAAQAAFKEKQIQAGIVREEDLTYLRESELFMNASPIMQKYMEMSVVLGEDFVNSMSKMTKGAKLETPTAAMIEQVAKVYEADPAFQALDAYSKWMKLTAASTRASNPSLQRGPLKTVGPDRLDTVAQDLADGKIGAHDLARLEPNSVSNVIARAVELGSTPSTTKKVATAIGAALQATGPAPVNPLTGQTKSVRQNAGFGRQGALLQEHQENEVPIGAPGQPSPFPFSSAGVRKRN